MVAFMSAAQDEAFRHNPLKRVKFISMDKMETLDKKKELLVTIPSNGSSLFQ